MALRNGENTEKNWFRSDRYLHINNKWYFVTREYSQEGPFDSKEDAERELLLYLRHADEAWFNPANKALISVEESVEESIEGHTLS